MTNILDLARSHVEALRNHRVPRTIAILDGLIAEIARLRAVCQAAQLAVATANRSADEARLEQGKLRAELADAKKRLECVCEDKFSM